MREQIDIDVSCHDIAANASLTASARARHMRALLVHFAAAGTPLLTICSTKYTGLAPDTIKAWCRRFRIALVDYTPSALKAKATKVNG